jgi:fructose 5-dehydrogenase small subunit
MRLARPRRRSLGEIKGIEVESHRLRIANLTQILSSLAFRNWLASAGQARQLNSWPKRARFANFTPRDRHFFADGDLMSHSNRDGPPSDFSPFRRKILIGGGVLLGGLAASQNIPTATPSASTAEFPRRFMELSSLLIPHRLDRDVGFRLAAALRMRDPGLEGHVAGLIAIAELKNATIVEDFFSDVSEGPLRDTALRIISAWYLGVVVDAPDAEVFAYELALMYQPTSDVMTIPTYAISGPNGWSSQAPPLSDMPKF